mgnify:CR=1 FL=1
MTFDMQGACAGFLYALETGANYIRSGRYKKVVVVSGDKMTSITDYQDRSTCPLFGDACGAVLLEPTTEEFGVLDTILRTDGAETEDEVTSAQFDVSDQRTLDEIVNWLMNMGDIPSFCTACYRAGRTGDRFMSLCKSKQISNCCHPNALMTLMEYLQDYASPETKKVGLELIQKELENIPSEKVKRLTEEHLADIVNGQRDFRF